MGVRLPPIGCPPVNRLQLSSSLKSGVLWNNALGEYELNYFCDVNEKQRPPVKMPFFLVGLEQKPALRAPKDDSEKQKPAASPIWLSPTKTDCFNN